MTAKKILNCARTLVVLAAITMGFIIALNQKTPKDTGLTCECDTNLVQPTNLEQVNAKLDRLLEEGRARDTVLLQQILKLQQQGNQAPSGLIAEIYKN